jgi:hypothetical protein
MRKIRLVLLAISVLTAGLSTSARADNIFGEFKRLPDAIERGFSVGFDFGLLFITDQPSFTTAENPGFNLNFTTGYDINDYFSVAGLYQMGITQTSASDVFFNGSVLTFLFGAVARGQYPLGRFYPFLEAGPAIYHSNNSWTTTGANNKMAITFASGIEYYTLLRHYSLYAKVLYNYIRDIPIDTLSVAVGLKYTF